MAKLSLQGIVIRRSGRVVLALDDLALEAGEVLGVIGPNGAGKSTLLAVAGGLMRPDAGEVRFEGEALKGSALAYRRRIAFAMQEPLLVSGSVLANVALGLKLRGIGAGRRREQAQRWLRRFGVEELASRPAGKTSGGEAQRINLARAFAAGPEILFLDEPFAGLDEPTRLQLLEELAGVLRETRVTTLFVTHDRDEALHLADRIAVLIDGRLRQVGPSSTVFGAPIDEDVAAFVGVETIVPGRVVAAEDGLAQVDVDGGLIAAVSPARAGDTVKVCIRPEDVELQLPEKQRGPTSARNLLAGSVIEVRSSGPTARVVVDCGFRLTALVTKLSVDDLGLRPGVRVAASVKETAVHLVATNKD